MARFSRNVSLELKWWVFLQKTAKEGNTSVGRLIEDALEEKYGKLEKEEKEG